MPITSWGPIAVARKGPMNKKYIVRLTATEREQLVSMASKGKAGAKKITHAHVLLKVDADGPSLTDEEVAEMFGVHENTVRSIRERFVMEGLESALNRKKRVKPPREPKLDGAGQARLTALACSTPPPGRARWTLRLLGDRLVELKVVESISMETVRKALKKTS
jgi:transposase